jgi:hypothetical protein
MIKFNHSPTILPCQQSGIRIIMLSIKKRDGHPFYIFRIIHLLYFISGSFLGFLLFTLAGKVTGLIPAVPVGKHWRYHRLTSRGFQPFPHISLPFRKPVPVLPADRVASQEAHLRAVPEVHP